MSDELVKAEQGMVPASLRGVIGVDENGALVIRKASSVLEIAGLQELNIQQDTLTSRLRIVQPTSQLAGNPLQGQVWDSSLEEGEHEVVVYPLRMTHTRIMWPEGDLSAKHPTCASNDGIIPRETQIIERQALKCEGCPMAEWGDDGEPPECSLGLTFIVATSDGFPSMVTFAKTSFRAGQRLNTKIARSGLPAFMHRLTLSTELETSEKGRWYQFVTSTEQLDPAREAPLILKLAKLYDATLDVQVTADEESDRDESAATAGAYDEEAGF